MIPCVLLDPAFRVRDLGRYAGVRRAGEAAVAAVWAWTRPGDMRAVQRYGARVIADVEDTSDATGTGWTGAPGEDTAAAALADVCEGVTSHGYVLVDCRRALSVFAERGRVVLPQVYKRDPTIPAHTFVRECVRRYRELGFTDVVPLLGVGVVERKGLAWLQAWAEACVGEGCNFHLYSYGAVVEGAPTLQRWVRSLAPAPEHVPALPVLTDMVAETPVTPTPATPVVVTPTTREYTGPMEVE